MGHPCSVLPVCSSERLLGPVDDWCGCDCFRRGRLSAFGENAFVLLQKRKRPGSPDRSILCIMQMAMPQTHCCLLERGALRRASHRSQEQRNSCSSSCWCCFQCGTPACWAGPAAAAMPAGMVRLSSSSVLCSCIFISAGRKGHVNLWLQNITPRSGKPFPLQPSPAKVFSVLAPHHVLVAPISEWRF